MLLHSAFYTASIIIVFFVLFPAHEIHGILPFRKTRFIFFACLVIGYYCYGIVLQRA